MSARRAAKAASEASKQASSSAVATTSERWTPLTPLRRASKYMDAVKNAAPLQTDSLLFNKRRRDAVLRGQGSMWDRLAETVAAGKVEEETVIRRELDRPTEHKYSTARFKISLRKLNDISRLIAHKPIDVAILQMEMSDKAASSRIKSTLCLARDHAVAKGLKRERLVVDESWVSKGGALKRIDPKGRGRMGVKEHRSSALHVMLREGQTKEEMTREKYDKLLKARLRTGAGVFRGQQLIRNGGLDQGRGSQMI